ncbi:MAG: hypothetical protein NC489_27880 [Ruminococcus flavefaciens]|nr:hypothetical protein [Ruminococcus flavefaciens]
MKYFLVEVSEQYTAPVPIGWYGIIDRKTLDRKSPYQMARHLLFSVESNMQMVFTDILTSPCYMVSETVRNVIRKYDPFVCFIRIILLDKEHRQSMAYYIPYLDTVQYSFKKNIDKKESYFEVDKKSIGKKALVRIIDGHHEHVIMRMDLVESILRRKTVGIGLREIQAI